MTYTVKLTAAAEADAYAAYEYIRRYSSRSAEKWLQGLFQSVFSLDEMPARCPVISESDEIGKPLRHLLYGKRTATYRIIFDIEDEAEDGPRVVVLRIWHGARDSISTSDLDAAE